MKLFGPLEGAQNELRDVAFDTLPDAPPNPVAGQFYRSQADGLVYQWSGAAWVYIGAIIDGSVTTAKIGDAQVTQAKLANNSVGAAQIIDGAVGTAELADAAVTLAKLGANSVDAGKIMDGEVGTNELANLAVTAAKIANTTITNAQIAAAAAIAYSKLNLAGSIVNADIAAGAAIAKSKLGALNIANADVAAGAAIDLAKLATNPLARANHTGTQLANTISDFAAAVQAQITVSATASLDLTKTAGGDISGVVLDSPKLGGVVAANYEVLANKNQPNGYAGLDAGGKIPDGLLPALAITETHVVDDEAEMLALGAQVGDVAIRLDENKSYILRTAGPGVLANWELLRAPEGGGGSVTSVGATAPLNSTGGINPVISINPNGITQGLIADGAVGTGELIDGNVTLAKLAGNSVDASKIVDGSVGTAELANDGVTQDKIADGAVGDAQVAAGIAVAKITGAVQKRTANIGNAAASSFVVNHALNTTDVTVTVKDAATGEVVFPTVFLTDANNVTVNFNGYVPALNAFRVIITG